MNYRNFVTYFENAAKSNKVIKHEFTPNRKTFFVMDIEEILAAKKSDLNEVALIIENPDKKGFDGLSDNKRKLLTSAFICIKPVAKGDHEAKKTVINEMELVAEQVLEKMTNDQIKYELNRNHPHKLTGFDINTVNQQVVNLFGEWHGWRTEFSLNLTWRNNLQLNNDDWLNDTKFIL